MLDSEQYADDEDSEPDAAAGADDEDDEDFGARRKLQRSVRGVKKRMHGSSPVSIGTTREREESPRDLQTVTEAYID